MEGATSVKHLISDETFFKTVFVLEILHKSCVETGAKVTYIVEGFVVISRSEFRVLSVIIDYF